MHTPITLLAMLPLLPLFIYLSAVVISHRRKHNISIGHGDDQMLFRKIRAHSNFAEYAPLSLLLLFVLETNGAPLPLLWSVAVLLCIGRFAHAYALSSPTPKLVGRVVGMVCSITALSVGVLGILLVLV